MHLLVILLRVRIPLSPPSKSENPPSWWVLVFASLIEQRDSNPAKAGAVKADTRWVSDRRQRRSDSDDGPAG